MRAAVLVFPGSNCDRDLAVAFEKAGARVSMVWHKDTGLPEGVDIVAVPGGFSYGDYLRCGAIAANSPICGALKKHVERGGFALGICNGFQVLTETRLLPGALRRNANLKYIYIFYADGKKDITYLNIETLQHRTIPNTTLTSGVHDGNGVQVGSRFMMSGDIKYYFWNVFSVESQTWSDKKERFVSSPEVPRPAFSSCFTPLNR